MSQLTHVPSFQQLKPRWYNCVTCSSPIPSVVHGCIPNPSGPGYICEVCVASQFQECEGCGDVVLVEDLTETSLDVFLCRECLEDYSQCKDCGDWFETGDMFHVDSHGDVCDECISDGYSWQDCCEQWAYNEDCYWVDDSCYCYDCLCETYHYCNWCGGYHSNEYCDCSACRCNSESGQYCRSEATADNVDTYKQLRDIRPMPEVRKRVKLDEVVRRVPLRSANMTTAAAEFYSIECMRVMEARGLRDCLPGHRAWIKYNRLDSLQRAVVDDHAHNVFHYLVLAVCGELAHARHPEAWACTNKACRSNRQDAILGNVIDAGLTYQEFAKAAVESFNTGGWSRGYGGRAWARIAHALLLWDVLPLNVWLDHVFDLQHNSGTVFDKRDEISYTGGLEAILSYKRYDTDPVEVVVRGGKQVGADIELHVSVGSALGLWKRNITIEDGEMFNRPTTKGLQCIKASMG